MKVKHSLLFLLAAAGCGAPRPPFTAIVGIDTSGSAKPFLGQYSTVTGALANLVRPGKDRFHVYRFDRNASEVFGPEPPRQPEEFAAKLVERLKPAESRGTRPAEFFQAAAARAAESALPVAVYCLTDGGNDDMSQEAKVSLREAAEALASNSKVRFVAFAGVVPGLREPIRKAMSALGDKLRFLEVEDVLSEAP